jgi:hypothetical protein
MVHGKQAMDRSLEKFGGETSDLPLYFTGGGSAIGFWAGGEGEISDVHANAGVVHGLSGLVLLPDVQPHPSVVGGPSHA